MIKLKNKMKDKVKLLRIVLFFLFFLISNLIILNRYSKNYIILAQNKKLENFKCLKCHKGSKSLPNIVKKKKITSAKELRFLVKKGPKSGLHLTVPDEDLEKAIQYLDLK